MNAIGWCIRVSLKDDVYGPSMAECLAKARVDAADFASKPHLQDTFFVFEIGEGEGKHLHGYTKTHKARNTIVSYLKAAFTIVDGNAGYSLKKANPAKMQDYLKYCAKGMDGNKGAPVECVFESEPHLWELLHKGFHDTADEIAKAKKHGPEEWYNAMATELKDAGLTTKEDVLKRVTKYYIEDSKKGFDKFAVTRTFWRVYALVCGSDAQALIYDSVAEMVFRI